MAIAKLEKLPVYDLGRKTEPWEKRHEEGKKLRRVVPRESHAEWQQPRNRPDPVKTVLASNKGRQAELIPLRMGRMAASPFAFLRGIGLRDGSRSLHHPNLRNSQHYGR
jgi:Uncharacterized protein conserved in bacteria (DUF2252)